MYLLILYQNPVAVVDLVLDDLCGEARKRFGFPLKFIVLILHFDRFVSCGFSRRAEERQTALLGFIRRGFKGNLGVIHMLFLRMMILSVLLGFAVAVLNGKFRAQVQAAQT